MIKNYINKDTFRGITTAQELSTNLTEFSARLYNILDQIISELNEVQTGSGTGAGTLQISTNSVLPTNPTSGGPSSTSKFLSTKHLADYNHGQIYHSNRFYLDQVSGVNTGDQNINTLSPLAYKGDILTHNGLINSRLGVGTNGYALIADSTQTLGLKWAAVNNDHASLTNLSYAASGHTGFQASLGYTPLNQTVIAGGTTGQFLKKTSNADYAVGWSTSTATTPLTTKGDIFVYSTTDDRLPVGTNGYVLSADSTTATGLKWVTAPGASTDHSTLTNLTYATAGHTGFLPDTHLTDFVHSDIAHTNRTALNAVSGTNTGDDPHPLTTKGDLFTFSTLKDRLPVGTNGQLLKADSTQTTGLVWFTPSYLVSPLTTKGDLLGFSTVEARLPVGTNGQYLTADSTTATGLKWYTMPSPLASPLTTKGDIFVYSTTNDRLAVGTNDYSLVADSTQTTGLKWKQIVGLPTGGLYYYQALCKSTNGAPDYDVTWREVCTAGAVGVANDGCTITTTLANGILTGQVTLGTITPASINVDAGGALRFNSVDAVVNVATDNWFLAACSPSGIAGATNNIGIGPGSFIQLDSGDYNIALGRYAGNGVTSQNYNISIGYLAGQTINANGNIFIGNYPTNSGSSIGSSNVAIGGYHALLNAGDNNISIGTENFATMTSSSHNNIGIGYGVANGFMTGSNYVFIDPVGQGQSALLYGRGHATTTSQFLNVNGKLSVIDCNLVVPKTSGIGIQIDTTSPTFGWRDITGQIINRGVGASDPDWTAFRSTIYAHRFTNGHMHEAWINFHMPHDYVPGTDIYIHTHWVQSTVDTGGTAGVPGVAKWYFDISYADGHGTAGGTSDPFIVPITQSATQQATTTQYGHMIAEVQFTNAGGDATHIDRGTLQVDGLILVRVYRDSGDVADTLNQDPFVLMVDLHYQSTNIGTKQKAPNFYT